MKYPIFYQKGTGVNIDELIKKMKKHKNNFDSLFGPTEWAFTGSAAVAVYTAEYNRGLLDNLDEPNDLDFLVQSDGCNFFSNKNIGEYVRIQGMPQRSMTFENKTTNEKIDVTSLPRKGVGVLDITIVNGLPLYNIRRLLSEYVDDDDFGVDKKNDLKIQTLNTILPFINVQK